MVSGIKVHCSLKNQEEKEIHIFSYVNVEDYINNRSVDEPGYIDIRHIPSISMQGYECYFESQDWVKLSIGQIDVPQLIKLNLNIHFSSYFEFKGLPYHLNGELVEYKYAKDILHTSFRRAYFEEMVRIFKWDSKAIAKLNNVSIRSIDLEINRLKLVRPR